MTADREPPKWLRQMLAPYDRPRPTMATYPLRPASSLADRVWAEFQTELVKAWDNGVDTAGQHAEQPWIVDDECKPLNPYRGVTP